jgi:hypothetical protein
MDEVVDRTMANLKLIAMINKGEKLCVRKSQLNIEQVDRLQPFRRWFNKDSRDNSLIYIRNTINDTIKITKSLFATDLQNDISKWSIIALNDELKHCETGLQNLKTTYVEDPSFIANLDVMIERCKAHSDEIEKGLQTYAKGNQTLGKKGGGHGNTA